MSEPSFLMGHRARSAAFLVLFAVLVPREARSQPLVPPKDAAPQTITPPRLVVDTRAEYPAAAIAAKLRDPVTVGLVLDVDATGAVTHVKVETPPQGHGFEEAATEAAWKLRFEPAHRGSEAIAARIRYRYVFKLPPPRLVGRCSDPTSDAPIAGARITVVGADGVARATSTGADGSWTLPDVPPGRVHEQRLYDEPGHRRRALGAHALLALASELSR